LTSCTYDMPRSACSVALETYHGASTIILRILYWLLWIIDMLERKISGSGLESQEYVRGHPLHWPRDTLYPQRLALTWPTSGGRFVGIVSSRTAATDFSLV
jgi:hypothetical protein